MNRAHIKTKIIKTTQTQKSTINDPYSRSGSFFVGLRDGWTIFNKMALDLVVNSTLVQL